MLSFLLHFKIKSDNMQLVLVLLVLLATVHGAIVLDGLSLVLLLWCCILTIFRVQTREGVRWYWRTQRRWCYIKVYSFMLLIYLYTIHQTVGVYVLIVNEGSCQAMRNHTSLRFWITSSFPTSVHHFVSL